MRSCLKRLRDWDGRLRLSETQAEGAFTQTFFVDTWGYGEAGRVPSEEHTIIAEASDSRRGRRRRRGRSRPCARLVSWPQGRHPAGPVRVQGHPLQARRQAEPEGKHAQPGRAVPELCPRRAARLVRQRAGPALVGPRHRHERVPPLLVGPRAGRIHPLFHPARRPPVGRLRPPERIGRRALRPLSLRQAVLPRHAAVGSGTAAPAPSRRAAMGARAQARRRVLRPLQGCARAPLQRPQAEQSEFSGQARRTAAADSEAARPLHLRLLLRGHGRADAVPAADAPGLLCEAAASSRSTTRTARSCGISSSACSA